MKERRRIQDLIEVANLFTSNGFVILDISELTQGCLKMERTVSETRSTINVHITPEAVYSLVTWSDVSAYHLPLDKKTSPVEILEWIESKDVM